MLFCAQAKRTITSFGGWVWNVPRSTNDDD